MVFQVVLSFVFAASLWLVWRRYRQQAVGRLIALLWTLGALGGFVLAWYPDTATMVAHLVGIGRGADLVVYLGIVLLFVLVFQLHVSHVRLERQLTKLVRKEALRDL